MRPSLLPVLSSRLSIALVLLVGALVDCGPAKPRHAATLFDPIEVPDVLGFLWCASPGVLTDFLPSAPREVDMPLLPDPCVLAMVTKEGFDAHKPVAIVLVDPQVYGSSIAYALGAVSEDAFLRSWRTLEGMQETPNEPKHFFANRRTLKLGSANFLGLPQAEVKRRDYHLRFADGYAVVLPSKDAETVVAMVLDRFRLRSASSASVSEFLSLDVDRLVRAHSDYITPLRDLMQRLATERGGEEQNLLATVRDAGQWLVDRVMDVEHLWLARSDTTLSAKLAIKAGSKLRADLSLLGGSLDQPFGQLPADVQLAFDCATEPARSTTLVRTFLPFLPVSLQPAVEKLASSARRTQWGVNQAGQVQLIDVGDEAIARAIASAFGVTAEALAAGAPTRIDLPPSPANPGESSPGAWSLSSAALGPVWFAMRERWVGFGYGSGECLQQALSGSQHFAPTAAWWPPEMMLGAVALMQSTTPEGTRYVARLGWSGDALLLDGKQVTQP